MTAELFKSPAIPALDANASPLPNATWNFYQSGTLTPATVYADDAKTTPHGASVESDGAGRFPAIFLDPTTSYRGILKDAGGATVPGYDFDPIGNARLWGQASRITLSALGAGGTEKSAEDALSLWRWVDRGGALGDGATDDTAAIQAVADDAGPGGILVFTTDSVYRVDTFANLTTGGLTGGLKIPSGQTWLLNGAELKALPSSAPGGSVVHGFQTSGWKILGPGKITGEKDIHIGSTGEWGHGISAWSSANWLVADVEISNCWGDGIYAGHAVAGEFCSNFTIRDNYIHGVSRNGISVVAGRGYTIADNVIEDVNRIAPRSGIDLEPDFTAHYNEWGVVRNNRIRSAEIGVAVVAANRDTIVSGNIVSVSNTALLVSDSTKRLLANDNHLNNTTGGSEGGAFRIVVTTPSTIEDVRVADNIMRGGGFFTVDGAYAGVKRLNFENNTVIASNTGAQGLARLLSGRWVGNEGVIESGAGVADSTFLQLTNVTTGRNRYENNSAFNMYSALSSVTDLGDDNYVSSSLRRGALAGASGPAVVRGLVTLAAGVATIANANVVSSTRLFLTPHTTAGTPGLRYEITARNTGVSIVATMKDGAGATQTLDTGIYAYRLEQ